VVRSAGRRATFAALAAAITWAGLTALLRDYPRHWERRAENYAAGGAALERVPPRSILFHSDFPEQLMRVTEAGVLQAFPQVDAYADFPGLVAASLRGGLRAFAVVRPDQLPLLVAVTPPGLVAERRWDVGPDFVMVEIHPAGAPRP
jgi:hypothetical protein